MLDQMTILSIDSIITVDSPKGRKAQMIDRPSYGITFAYEGQITYTHHEEQVISNSSHMVLLPKGESYELYGNTSGRFPVINIQCMDEPPIHTILAFPLYHPESYLIDFERLKELFLLKTDRQQCFSILYGMLSRIQADSSGSNRLIRSAIEFISQHYSKSDLTNADIAAHIGISEVYLNKLFRSQIRKSTKQYVIDIRMKKAQQLLAEGGLTISQIAEQCGYASVYHFSRAFRKAMGESPSDYRRATWSGGVI